MQKIADPEYTSNQMWQIRYGYENKFTDEQMALLRNKELDHLQMNEISNSFYPPNIIPADIVKIYANPELNTDQIHFLNLLAKEGKSKELITFCADPRFSSQQTEILCNGVHCGLDIDKLKVYADPDLTPLKMEEILEGFYNGLAIEDVERYAKKEYTAGTMHDYRILLEHGIKDMELYNDIKEKYSYLEKDQLMELGRAASMGFSWGKIDFLASKKLAADELKIIINSSIREKQKTKSKIRGDERNGRS